MAMTLDSTRPDHREFDTCHSEKDPSVVGVPIVARALPVITARLRARHPAVPAVVLERHVSAAAARLIREARIFDYLPILIERTAAASLAGGDC